MGKNARLDSFDNGSLFSLKKENTTSSEEQERIKELKQQIEYLLERYSNLKINYVGVRDGLVCPGEYLKSLLAIIKSQASYTRFGKLLEEFANTVSDLDKYLIINKHLFRYGLRIRPLMVGGVPLGFIADSLKSHTKFKFGTIDYPIALSEHQITDYELIPLFVDKAMVKWCAPELKKALEIGVNLPTSEITCQEAIDLVRQMKASQNKLASSLQKHWQTMINRVVSAFGADFESLI